MGIPRLSPTVPYADTVSKASQAKSIQLLRRRGRRDRSLTKREDIEPQCIRNVLQLRSLNDAHDYHAKRKPPHI